MNVLRVSVPDDVTEIKEAESCRRREREKVERVSAPVVMMKRDPSEGKGVVIDRIDVDRSSP